MQGAAGRRTGSGLFSELHLKQSTECPEGGPRFTQSDPSGQQQSWAPAEAGQAYIRPSQALPQALRQSSKPRGAQGLALEDVSVLTKKHRRGQRPGLLPHTGRDYEEVLLWED